ncbi:hypothetical protein GGS21DRAFT_354749 [Xylaria nigripes]|nr:hypothetical protein GGS21DRAFT_354749 [Xylaria nigripes]
MQLLRYSPFLAAALAVVIPLGEVSPNGVNFPNKAVKKHSITDGVGFRNKVPEGYSVTDIEWRGIPDFDKDHVFTGTIEDVVDQMRAIKGSSYTPAFMMEHSTDAAGTAPTDKHGFNVNDGGDHYITCGGPEADPRRIQQGVDYLSHLPDSSICSMGPGPKNCGRISCSWNSGIWWCNEKNVTSDTYQCSLFATYASELLDNCAIYDRNPRVAGANFDNGYNFTVLVKEAWC